MSMSSHVLPRGSRGVVIGVVSLIAIIEAIMDVRLPKILLPLLVLQVVRTSAIACPSAPAKNAIYPFTYGTSGGIYYFAARINSNNSTYIDMTLESFTQQGWVAVGFSATSSMSDADVFGCHGDGNTIHVVDTWNPSRRYSENILDNNQDGMCHHYSEHKNGRMKCVFSRYIGVINVGQDLNLDQPLFHFYDALSLEGRPLTEEGLSKHLRTPSVTLRRSNVVTLARSGGTEEISTWPKEALIKTHGILMIISWILLAASGAFFSTWVKPVFPNPRWFNAHRLLMAQSLIVGVLGFCFAFIAHAKGTIINGLIDFDHDGVNTTHFIFGILIMLLHFINPIMALFRCKPTSSKRWIFNLSHTIIAWGSFLLAFINIGIGSALLASGVLVAYIVFILVLIAAQGAIFAVFTVNAFRSPREERPKLLHNVFKCMHVCKVWSHRHLQPVPDDEQVMELQESVSEGGATLTEEEHDVAPTATTTGTNIKLPKYAMKRFIWIALALQLSVLTLATIGLSVMIALDIGHSD